MKGKELKKLRIAAGLTQEKLAIELGVDRSAVTRWETTGSISKVYQKILTNYFNPKNP